MITLSTRAIERPLNTWILILFCVFGGLWGFLNAGRLEDPAFTIKEAVVVTLYPGATAAEVAREVSEPLEAAIQKMSQVQTITSRNRPGVSEITVEIKPTYDSGELPQIWDELRNEVSDAAVALPQAAGAPMVNDTFGDVYGIFYAVTTPGFSDTQIHAIATFLRRQLLTVDGVADVEIQGLPEEAIFVSPWNEQMVQLGVPPGTIIDAIANSDRLEDAGSARNGQARVQIEAPAPYDTTEAIAGLTFGFRGQVLNLFDVSDVYRARVDEPMNIVRFNGEEAFTFAVSGIPGVNIVDVGYAVERHVAALAPELPVGVEVRPIYEQHRVVEEANDDFLISLALSVGIVIGILAILMGWRAAIVVGATLVLTVNSTFFFMALFDIQMERISLGALIIAMGMLVDNAIVIAEGMQTRMRQGMSARDAVDGIASRTSLPLLGATVIGIMAFAGIGTSPDATGEFLFSLFAVISLSLSMSWILAVTATPLMGRWLFRIGAPGKDGDAYNGLLFRAYGRLLALALRLRWPVTVSLVALTVLCMVGFGKVQQQFFPFSTTPLFYLNYKLSQGSSIRETSADMTVLEDWLLARDDVVAVTTSVGFGVSRFMLTYDPERPDPSYGQLIVRTQSAEAIPRLMADLKQVAAQALPHAEARTERLVYGPPVTADLEPRFSGKDPDVLRALAGQAAAIMHDTPSIMDVRLDWREREVAMRPIYVAERAQAVGVAREEVAQALLLASDGVFAGQLREDDRLVPIYVRLPAYVRARSGALLDQVVYSDAAGEYVPITQFVDGFAVEVRDTLVHRRDRAPTLTVQADTVDGVTPATALAQVRDRIEAIPLPVGYHLEWGGEFEESTDAQMSLARQLPIGFLLMILISILLFGRLRQPFVIWMLVPMAVNGVTLGLLATGLPFSFTALLGLLSLSGMLIKNGIVLVEEIDAQRRSGLDRLDAIVSASKSRLYPVTLAAGTTILGMVPLLSDAFFASMAVTIMGGLAFATFLTLIAAPVFYRLVIR